MTARVAVTGAVGFIGQAVVSALQRSNHEPLGLSRTKHPSTIADDLIDVDRLTELFISNDVSTVCHCAWTGHPRSTDVSHRDEIQGNITNTLNVALASGRAGVRHLVFLSSGGGRRTHLDDGRPAPPYGWAKAVASASVLATAEAFGYTATVLRPTAVYGPGQDPAKRLGVVSVFTTRLLLGEPLEVIGSNTRRDFLHADDLADLVVRCLEQRTHGEFDVGGPEVLSIDEVINALHDITHIEPTVRTVPSSGVDPDVVRLDNTAVTAATGWVPTRTLAASLPDIVSTVLRRLDLLEQQPDLAHRLGVA
ncbi:MAG: NAD-dependent epimerase/dehydratase family protein [Actinobacteria bacterium]|nr:NAD-dependent epimerase/dehydratase family protein [Actinomycetota bacterium]